MQEDNIEAATAEIAKQQCKPAEATKTGGPPELQHQASTEQTASQKQQAPQEQGEQQGEAPEQPEAAKVEASSQPAKSATPAAPSLGKTHLEHPTTPETAPATDATAEHATETGGPPEVQHQASNEHTASQKQQAPQEQGELQGKASEQLEAAKVEASSQPAKSATPAAPSLGKTHLEHPTTRETAPATDATAEHATETGGPPEVQHQASNEQTASQKQQAPQEQGEQQGEASEQPEAAKVEASSQPAKSATPAAPSLGKTHLEHPTTPETAPATDATAKHATETGGPPEVQHQAGNEHTASQKQQAPQEQGELQGKASEQLEAAKVEASSQPAKSAAPAAPSLGKTHLEHPTTRETAPATDATAEHATETGGPPEVQHQASNEQTASQKQQAPQEQGEQQGKASEQPEAAKVEASSQPAKSATPAVPSLGKTHLEHPTPLETAPATDAKAEHATKTGGPPELQHQASTEKTASQKHQAPQQQGEQNSEASQPRQATKAEAAKLSFIREMQLQQRTQLASIKRGYSGASQGSTVSISSSSSGVKVEVKDEVISPMQPQHASKRRRKSSKATMPVPWKTAVQKPLQDPKHEPTSPLPSVEDVMLCQDVLEELERDEAKKRRIDEALAAKVSHMSSLQVPPTPGCKQQHENGTPSPKPDTKVQCIMLPESTWEKMKQNSGGYFLRGYALRQVPQKLFVLVNVGDGTSCHYVGQINVCKSVELNRVYHVKQYETNASEAKFWIEKIKAEKLVFAWKINKVKALKAPTAVRFTAARFRNRHFTCFKSQLNQGIMGLTMPRPSLFSTPAWFINLLPTENYKHLQEVAAELDGTELRVGTACSGIDVCVDAIRGLIEGINHEFGVAWLQFPICLGY